MPLIKEPIKLKNNDDDKYPFSVPIIKNLDFLDLSHNVTIIVGENGSGKSTLLEIVALKLKLYRISFDSSYQDEEFLDLKQAIKDFKITYKVKPQGFFFRSEDFITYLHFLEHAKREAYAEINRIKEEYQYKSTLAKSLAMMPHYRTLNDIESMYNNPLLEVSHGESYLDFFKSRLKPNSLYILDEAEVPLSIQNQLTLLLMIKEAVDDGCQFIISTHSPVLMSYPNAFLYEIKNDIIEKVSYDEITSVRLLKDFLNYKDNYLRHLFE